MRILRYLLPLLVAFSLTSPAAAYWDYGHQVVARIAWLNIRPETRAELGRLMRQSRLLDTPTCPARTIEEVSVWPDCIKSLGERFSYSASWHYQNVDICRPFDPDSACRDGNCVSVQIERNARLLADRSVPARERLMALAFLVHFVGDLHQPMHAGDHGDLGGNRVAVSYGIIAGRTNLHLAWDGYVAERAITTPPGSADGILSELSDADKAAMKGGSIDDWARENWEIARDTAYRTVNPDPCGPEAAERPMITEAITRSLIPVVRRQVARGGLRLARMLDEAFAPDSPWRHAAARRRR
ncbi:S1/P1 nuclease [Sphingosinicella sp. LHD-64]|uniref:S1/P1 nuclease n=1 Tax=Sphingosinicella sp. LHD-64 TaxID=3072139 RepID=UPI002810296C|nr:S1/P1 nuclease [Sphingosinicella sp. LHD-64]MDQ8758035.1 S1/P1 nuclease [Sphingosinicella sp. LHD-64]